MSRRLDIRLRFSAATALAVCTMLSVGSLSPLFAASNLITEGGYDRLAGAEQVFFGKPDTTNTYLKRLELLEIGIFGRVRSGSQEKRFERISDALGLKAPGAGANAQNQNSRAQLGVASGDNPPIAASTGLLNPTFMSGGSPNLTDTDSPEHLKKLSESGSAGLGAASNMSDESSTRAASVQSSTTSGISNGSTNPDRQAPANVQFPAQATAPVIDNFKTRAKAPGGAGLAAASGAPQAKSATDSKLRKTTPGLIKEPPKLEPQVAHSVLDNDHRLQRPAVASGKDAIEDKNKEIESLFKKGMTEFRDKHFGEAQICFKKILVIDPRNIDAYYNLGSMAEAKREYVDALTYYRAALATKPTDKDLKSAVHAMEEELHKQRGKTAASTDHHAAALTPATKGTRAKVATTGGDQSSNKADRYTPEVNAGMQSAPISEISTTDAPGVPIQQVDEKTFSLQTAQNGLNNQFGTMNGVNAPYQGVPIYGVPPTLSGNVPANGAPIGSITPNSNRNTFNSMLSAGAGLALRGSGLHCPICRVLGGLH